MKLFAALYHRVSGKMTDVQNDPDRIGVMIRRRGTWRETVAFYGSHRNLTSQCVARYDSLVLDGWQEAWAALRALDDHNCADIIISNETMLANRTIN